MTWYDFDFIYALPIRFNAVSEKDPVGTTKLRQYTDTVCSKNKKLTKMTKRDARRMGNKKVRILFWSTNNGGIMAENGRMHFNKGRINFESGWGNIMLKDIIDWYQL